MPPLPALAMLTVFSRHTPRFVTWQAPHRVLLPKKCAALEVDGGHQKMQQINRVTPQQIADEELLGTTSH